MRIKYTNKDFPNLVYEVIQDEIGVIYVLQYQNDELVSKLHLKDLQQFKDKLINQGWINE